MVSRATFFWLIIEPIQKFSESHTIGWNFRSLQIRSERKYQLFWLNPFMLHKFDKLSWTCQTFFSKSCLGSKWSCPRERSNICHLLAAVIFCRKIFFEIFWDVVPEGRDCRTATWPWDCELEYRRRVEQN